VSYANSPNNRSKGGSLGLAAASIVNGQGPHFGPNQPLGDTALLHKDLMNNDIGYSPNQHNESSMMGS
jgi:hypothetical protein